MGILRDERQRAINMIMNTLQKADWHNITNIDDPRMLEKDLFLAEICKEFKVSMRTATEYFEEALKLNGLHHDMMGKQERKLRLDLNGQ